MASNEFNPADPAIEPAAGETAEYHNPVLTRDPFRKHDRRTGLVIGIAIAAVSIAVAGAVFLAHQEDRSATAAPESAAASEAAPA